MTSGMAPALAFAVVLAHVVAPASGEGHLVAPSSGGLRRGGHAATLRIRSEAFQTAMGSVLGGGQNLTSTIAQSLRPIWQAMPKNDYDRIEWRQMRYLMHRHFMQKSSFMIRGLEPMHEVTESNHGTAKILQQKAPALAEMLLDGHRADHGFSFQDAISLAAALEQLIFNSETELLERVYAHQRLSPNKHLSRKDLQTLVRTYVIFWMLGEDEESARILASNASLTEQAIPHWKIIESLAHGTVQSMEYSRQRSPKLGDALVAWMDQYSF